MTLRLEAGPGRANLDRRFPDVRDRLFIDELFELILFP